MIIPSILNPEYRTSVWPKLTEDVFQKTSPKDVEQNCVAFALGYEKQWWQAESEDPHVWPSDAINERTIPAWISACRTEGYEVCKNGKWESRFEKIAIYARNGMPTHAAKQWSNGRWRSKLGEIEDIEG